MNWKKLWPNTSRKPIQQSFGFRDSIERETILADLVTAKEEWTLAQKRFETAKEQDQIDFAIYSLIAAEKKYCSVLKRAKFHQIHYLRDGCSGKEG